MQDFMAGAMAFQTRAKYDYNSQEGSGVHAWSRTAVANSISTFALRHTRGMGRMRELNMQGLNVKGLGPRL